MNADHVESMVMLAKVYAGIEGSEAAMTSVDRLGFTLRLKTAEGMKGPRINFLGEVTNAQETRKMLVEMVKQAKAKESV
jgi:putative heme iron utilization protein